MIGLDLTFDGDGRATTDVGGSDNVFQLENVANNKILAIGQRSGTNGITTVAIARYNSDGSLDSSFGLGGILDTGVRTSFGTRALVAGDGKIIVGGRDVNGRGSVTRLLENGQVDLSFATAGVYTTTRPDDILNIHFRRDPVSSSEEIVVNQSSSFESNAILTFTLLNAMGQVVPIALGSSTPEREPTVSLSTLNGLIASTTINRADPEVQRILNIFGEPLINQFRVQYLSTNYLIRSILTTAQSDGSIVAGFGASLTQLPINISLSVRVDPQGNFDSNFGTNGFFIEPTSGLASPSSAATSDRNDGNYEAIYDPSRNELSVYHFTRNGRPDTGFGTNGRVLLTSPVVPSPNPSPGFSPPLVLGLDTDDQGRIVLIAKTSGSSVLDVFRLSTAGVVDPTFGVNGRIQLPSEAGSFFISAGAQLDSSNRLLIGGTANNDFLVSRFDIGGATLPTITLTVDPVSIDEGASGATPGVVYTFTRTGATQDPLTVSYRIAGTADSASDYLLSGEINNSVANVSFDAGASTATVSISPRQDGVIEGDETVSLELISPLEPNYTVGTATAVTSTILDRETALNNVSLTVVPSSVIENDNASGNLIYNFVRTGPITESLAVDFNIGGTAEFNTDYVVEGATALRFLSSSIGSDPLYTGRATFAAGSDRVTVLVNPTVDSLAEADESVTINLVPSRNDTMVGGIGRIYNIDTPDAITGIITDAVPTVNVALETPPVTEDGTNNLVYIFTRTGSTAQPLTINYNISGTAAFTADYNQIGANSFTDTTGSITFEANSATATLTITPVADSIVEANEVVTLNLVGNSTYSIGSSNTASGTIVDVPPIVVVTPPTVNLAVSPTSVNEGGTDNLLYTFTRSGSTGESLTVSYSIGGTADSSNDYTISSSVIAASANVTFNVGANIATIVVDPTQDSLLEGSETVELTLGSGQYIIGNTAAVVGNILDPNNATIRTSAGDGELVVSLDQFGRFGRASGVDGSAFYDPLGTSVSSDTTFSSYVALGIIGGDGITGSRTVLEPTTSNNEIFTGITITTANSGFIVGGLQFQLNQLVQDARSTEQNRTGSRLDQTYTVTNTTNQTINFDLVRYVDGDLLFDNTLIDGGGRIVQNGQEILFETDRGGTGQTDTTFFGITGIGGTIPTTNRFEIDDFGALDSAIQAGTVLRDRVIQGDTNSDLFIDSGAEYDVALGLRNIFSLAPGASSIYTTTTRFGSGEPAQLDITPPVGGIANLAANTLGTNINLAWSATDPSGVRGYDVFVSTNGGIYTPFQTGVTTTSAVFTGLIGNTYAFYALATDNAGNSQVVAGAPIATTQLVETLPPVNSPVITLTLDPVSITESANSGIVYTFARTGSLGTPLIVRYSISGTAAFGDDYLQTGASNFTASTGTIEFATNSSLARLTITPIADSVFEPNETVDLTLLSGSGYGNSDYVIGTPDTITGTIINTSELPPNGLNFIGTNNLDVGTVNNSGNGVFAVNPNNINFVGDEINLLGGADSVIVPNRNVTLQPSSPNQAIQIGSVDSNSASILDLTPTDLAAIANGFSKIIIGRTNGTGNIDINTNVTFRDPILLQSPGGQLNINAPITLAGDATLDFNVQSLVKSGINTLTISGNNATTFIGNTIINGGVLLLAKSANTEALNNAPISVNGGILQLGNNGQINNAADLTLNGGTFNLNGFNETLDRLQVTTNSTINLGNGSSKLAFGNSSTANWTGVLSIENWSSTSGESLRFGNSATGLTAAQLSNIQFVGFARGASINASGFIAPIDITIDNPVIDQDGVSDDIEDLAPNDGDGNLDGILDSLQENVVSIINLGGVNVDNIATVIARAGARISGLRSLANPITTATLTSLANPIEFKVTGLANGAATTVEYLIAKADQNRRYNTYLMFGATTDNATPHAYEFLYDGQTGAELFDTNGDGFTDKAIVHFVDGQRGDSDLSVNGEIQDPGAPGISSTPISLSIDTNNVVQLTGTAGAAIANFSLVANQTKQVSEVGFFKIDGANAVRGIAANAADFARTALQSGQVIFSSLADNLLSTTDISRQLQLNAGDRLGFYLVQNGTVDNALQKNDFSNVLFSIDQANPASRKALEVTTETNGSYRLKWEQDSATVADDLILNLQLQSNPLNNQNLVAGIQGDRESELLDLSSFTGQDVQVNFTIKREAAFNDTVGFYKVEDAQGTVTSITGAKIKPGETGYQAAVVQNRITGVDLAVANGQTASIDAVLRGGAIYAPFLIANANPGNLNGNFSNVYTSFTVGNSDTTDHVRLLGDNTFGFEDLVGGGDQDFNDVVLKAVFKNS